MWGSSGRSLLGDRPAAGRLDQAGVLGQGAAPVGDRAMRQRCQSTGELCVGQVGVDEFMFHSIANPDEWVENILLSC